MRSIPPIVAGTAIAASTIMLSVPAHASTIYYVGPGQSIQAAVDAASPGSTIRLAPGVYSQSVTISTNDITLTGAGSGPNGTVLVPPAVEPDNQCGQGDDSPSGYQGGGICVFGNFDPDTGVVYSRVTGVRVSGIRLENEPGESVAAFATDGLSVDNVTAVNSGAYGIIALASTNGRIVGNTITGVRAPDGSGMFLGALPESHMLISGNTVSDASLGIFMQDVGDMAVTGNTSTGNCIGALLFDDNQSFESQPIEYGNIVISGNVLSENNDPKCAAAAQSPPVIQGTGLLTVGTSNTVIIGNTVTGNVGPESTSGGIVTLSGAPFGALAESNDVIAGNTVRGNGPDDLVWDRAGSGVVFRGNNCANSSPSGLC
jgi:hypothetical protein